MQKVVFHGDGEVSVAGIRVGVWRGKVGEWRFCPVRQDRTEGPFRTREPIRTRAKEVYKKLHGK